jgi:hypothetical protein
LEFFAAGFGLVVAIAMLLMKVVPAIPGHFSIYEWIALGIWVGAGALAGRHVLLRENA